MPLTRISGRGRGSVDLASVFSSPPFVTCARSPSQMALTWQTKEFLVAQGTAIYYHEFQCSVALEHPHMDYFLSRVPQYGVCFDSGFTQPCHPRKSPSI